MCSKVLEVFQKIRVIEITVFDKLAFYDIQSCPTCISSSIKSTINNFENDTMNWPGRTPKRKCEQTDVNENFKKTSLSNNNDNDNNNSNSSIQEFQSSKIVEKEDNCSILVNQCDTELAIESLKQRDLCMVLPHSRLVLRHMVDYVLDHGKGSARSRIEGELGILIAQNKIRRFQLLADDIGIMSSDEYLIEASHVLNETHVFQIFVEILNRFQTLSANHEDLLAHIQDISQRRINVHQSRINSSELVERLVTSNLLKPRRDKQSNHVLAYWFALPNTDKLMKWLVEGRKEILLKIKRSLHKEVARLSIENQSMKSSDLGGVFHIRDLLAKEVIYIKNTASSDFVNIVYP